MGYEQGYILTLCRARPPFPRDMPSAALDKVYALAVLSGLPGGRSLLQMAIALVLIYAGLGACDKAHGGISPPTNGLPIHIPCFFEDSPIVSRCGANYDANIRIHL